MFFKRLRIVLARAVLLIIGCCLLFWIGRHVYRFYLLCSVRTVQAKEGNLAAIYSGEAVILQNEVVVRAPCSGHLRRIQPEGSLVRSGQVVAELQPQEGMEKQSDTIHLSSPISGFVCYHPDGWEGVLVPDEWSRLDLARLFDDFKADLKDHSQVSAAGEPVFKVIDNLLEPYLVIKLTNAKDEQIISVDDRIGLQWSGGSGKGKVIGIKAIDKTLFIVVDVLVAEPRLPDDRLLRLKVIKTEGEGIVLPAEAVVRRKSSIGVFTYSPLGFRFRKVEIKGMLGDRVAVTGIDPGLEVVVNPSVATKIQKDI